MIILPPTFGFFHILAVSTTDKPVNRSVNAYAHTWLNVFCVKEGIPAIRAIKYKIMWLEKIHLPMRTFGAEVHKSNLRVKRRHNKYENSELE